MKLIYVLILTYAVLIQRDCNSQRNFGRREDGWHYTNAQKQPSRYEDDGYYHDSQIVTQYLSPTQNNNSETYADSNYANYENVNYPNNNYANERPQMTWLSPMSYDNYRNPQYVPPTNYFVSQTSVQPHYDRNVGNTDQDISVPVSIGEFGLKMLQITNQRRNVVLSPYSIATLLGLLQQGSRGGTLQQLSSALQLPVEVAATGFRQLTNNLRIRQSRRNLLNIATNIYVAAGFSLNQDFENKARNNFGSEVTSLNFAYSSQAEQTINDWVSRATNHNINQLLLPGSISGNTQLVLVNALHFKGVWQMKFREQSTQSRMFNVNGVQKKPANFMRARKNYRYGEDSSSQIVVLPFENEEYTLTIILPSQKASVEQILPNLNYNKLAEYQTFKLQDVDLEIPKFSVRSDTDLRPLLGQMGITNMFGGSSELFGIVNQGYNSPQVSSAIHSAMLSIDEEGGTAAAATAFTVVALSFSTPDAVFKADRPFFAVLWDTKLSLPLIMAKIEDPTS